MTRLLTISLILSLFSNCSLARNCVLNGGEYNTIINIIDQKVDDNAEVFLEIVTENVENVEIANPGENTYIDAEYANNLIMLKPSQEFKDNFEKNTAFTKNPRVTSKLKLTCSDGDSYEIDYLHAINDINTYPPVFSKDTYEFEVPMPMPGEVELTTYGEDFLATDYDVSNEGIDFTIEGDGSEVALEVVTTRSSSNSKDHIGVLKTKTPFRITQETTYTITATDRGSPSVKTATAQFTIRIKQEGTLPPSPSFESGYYEANYDNSNTEHAISPTTIKVSEGVSKDNIVLKGGTRLNL